MSCASISQIDSEIRSQCDAFYSSLPHKVENQPITSVRVLAQKQDLCQLVRDVVAVSESTNWSVRSGSDAKYGALRCNIECLDPSCEEYSRVLNRVTSSQEP